MADNQDENVSRHGGKRDGAGRPSLLVRVTKDPRWLAARGVSALTAGQILEHVVDEGRAWKRIFESEDDRVVLQALVFLMSMRDGKPAQQINVTSQSIVLRADDIARAREIVAEIKGQLSHAGPTLHTANPSLGSPLPTDASCGDRSEGEIVEGECIAVGESPIVRGEESAKPMLCGDDGGNSGGHGSGSGSGSAQK